MGILGKSKKPVFNVAKPTIRVENVPVEKPPSSAAKPRSGAIPTNGSSSRVLAKGTSHRLPARPSKLSSSSSYSGAAPSVIRTSASPAPRYKSSSPFPSGSGDERSRKRKTSPQNASTPRFDESDDDEDDDFDFIARHKKPRISADGEDAPRDPKRVIRNARSFAALGQHLEPLQPPPDAKTNGNGNYPLKSDKPASINDLRIAKRNGVSTKTLRFVHAADLAAAARNKGGSSRPNDQARSDNIVELQYPASRSRERYELVVTKDQIDPTTDIIDTVKNITNTYLTDTEAIPFLDISDGHIRRLEKFANLLDYPSFRNALASCNAAVLKLLESGAISRNLSLRRSLPSSLCHFVLSQVYDRAVAPDVERLSKYDAGSDYIYGELKPAFITEILTKKTGMTSDQVFVDLGSGVGNVVLQAALEIGCEAWGWEYQAPCCDLAAKQQAEFQSRCQLWGLAPGKVNLGRGDFLQIEKVNEVLRRADVVLVNNQVFTSGTNEALVRMFLDLKVGARVVSLRSFVHHEGDEGGGGKGGGGGAGGVGGRGERERGEALYKNDVGSTILDVEVHRYPEDWVSWTHSGGSYCVSTKK